MATKIPTSGFPDWMKQMVTDEGIDPNEVSAVTVENGYEVVVEMLPRRFAFGPHREKALKAISMKEEL